RRCCDGLSTRARGDAVPLHQRRLAGTLLARSQTAGLDLFLDVVSDLEVHRLRRPCPYCARHSPWVPPMLLYMGNRTREAPSTPRSEEHTSELQSRENLVCRLLLEKKK